jgi:hypothetical protein
MTDVYKLIEDIKNSESPYIEDILAALRRLALAEKVVEEARSACEGGSVLGPPFLSEALAAYDAAKGTP